MSDTIRIRMYNVGFGDCFLLLFPGDRTMLVDAGFHSQGKGAFSGHELAQQVIEDLLAATGKARIDVIIATHRHQDHVYAFNSDTWDEVEVGEVWMPWVDDPDNDEALGLWEKQIRFAMRLAAAMPTFELDAADREDVEFMLWNAGIDSVPAPFGVGGWTNAGAIRRLRDGFKRRDRKKPRYLPRNNTFPESFEAASIPGLIVHVLGPPRDPELIEELDPEADGETYRALALRAAGQGHASDEQTGPPFGAAWHVKPEEAGEQLMAEEIERLRDLARTADALMAAHMLDDMINSTSLVIVLQFGDARLLLPGDAEWGTWKRILGDEQARELVESATFFKVGHHGSHNATSKTLVEEVLPKSIPAMISTQQGPGKYRNNIPLPELLAALEGHEIEFVRSDRARGPLPEGFSKGTAAKWVDLELSC